MERKSRRYQTKPKEVGEIEVEVLARAPREDCDGCHAPEVTHTDGERLLCGACASVAKRGGARVSIRR